MLRCARRALVTEGQLSAVVLQGQPKGDCPWSNVVELFFEFAARRMLINMVTS